MIGFLKSLADFVMSVVSFVVTIFQMIINLFLLIPKGLSYVIAVIDVLPPFVKGVIIVSVSISVIIMVVNHGGD